VLAVLRIKLGGCEVGFEVYQLFMEDTAENRLFGFGPLGWSSVLLMIKQTW